MKQKEQAEAGHNPIGVYLRDVGRHKVMNADQERTLATKLRDERIALWDAILAYPPFVEGIVAIVESVEMGELPAGVLDSVVKSSRAYRDRETRKHRDLYETDRRRAAEACAISDQDLEASEILVDDLQRLREQVLTDDGGGPNELQVVKPPKNSRPFLGYVDSVLAADFAVRRTRDQFVRANLRLVVSMARRFECGMLALSDLVQEGNLGLMKAVDRFDVSRGFRFSTYASWWIRHALNRALANKGRLVRLPAHVSADQQRIARTRREFENVEGRRPTRIELADRTGLSVERIRKLSKVATDAPTSLDMPVGDEDARTRVDLLTEDDSPGASDLLEHEALVGQLGTALDKLQPIEADILRQRFGLISGEGATLRELGERHSLSRERIRQLQERALGKLRREFARRDLL